MEAYAILGLIGLGTLFSSRVISNKSSTDKFVAHANEVLDRRGYEPSKNVSDVSRNEWSNAQKMARAARYPAETGVIDSNSRRLAHDEFSITKPVFSELAGVEFSAEDFRHSNEQPYYGSKITQSTSNRLNESKLEDHTGAIGPGNSMPKREVESFFSPSMGVAYPAGTPSTTSILEMRSEAPVSRNNILPFEQVRVGPGVGQGYTSEPTGGYTQPQDRDFVMPKNIDQLRPLSNQRPLLEGRVIPGAAPAQRGMDPVFFKNKQDTLFDISDRGLIATSGPTQARSIRPNVDHSFSRNPRQTVEHFGPSGSSTNEATPARPNPELKDRLAPDSLSYAGAVSMPGQSSDPNALYSSDELPSNERTFGYYDGGYFGNPARIVGSAPLDPHRVSGIRESDREELQDSKRMFNSMSIQIPSQGPAYDIDERPRTTLRETLVDQSRYGNIGGNQGTTIANAYDPDSRFTIREHAHPSFHRGNISTGENRIRARDGENLRSTTRETTHSERSPIPGPGDRSFGGYSHAVAPEAFVTNRELSTSSYVGISGDVNPSGGYGAAQSSMQVSMKDMTLRDAGHSGHFGAVGGDRTKPMSYEALYNETVRTVRDDVNSGRILNPVGPDSGKAVEFVGEHRSPAVGLQTSRVEGGDHHYTYNSAGGGVETGSKSELPYDDRLDTGLLDYVRNNPFVVGPNGSFLHDHVRDGDSHRYVDPSRTQAIS
jgi:hypothetical protein